MTDVGFSFRLRFRLAAPAFAYDTRSFDLGEALGLEAGQLVVETLGHGTKLSLARDLVLIGHGYVDEAEAGAAGEAWADTLLVALASLGLGADLGARTTPMSGGLTREGYKILAPHFGYEYDPDTPIEAEHLGVHTFRSASRPRYTSGSATAYVPTTIEALAESVAAARPPSQSIDDEIRTSYAMFSAAATIEDLDARLLMLSSAFEVLVTRAPRSPETVAYLEKLIDQTRKAELDPEERALLMSGLSSLKTQSINRAGQDLAATLRESDDERELVRRSFKDAYGVRSKLTHGSGTTRDQVAGACAVLEGLLRELLGDRLSHKSEV
ncbi:hypothetical protein [Isoptericola sp. NPDC055881]